MLESPPGAAGWQGIGWWRELVALARAEAPDLDIAAVLDCGAAPGLALAALKAGCGRVRVVADGAALEALLALAPDSAARCWRADAASPGGAAAFGPRDLNG